MAASDAFGWLDVEIIGEELAAIYPEKDPMTIGFVELRKLVETLPDFKAEPGHPVNEKILEHIQKFWIEEREDRREDEDES